MASLLFVLLGAATTAEAQVQQELAKRYFEERRSSASETRAGCGVCRPGVRW
jgi:hypothetical protein